MWHMAFFPQTGMLVLISTPECQHFPNQNICIFQTLVAVFPEPECQYFPKQNVISQTRMSVFPKPEGQDVPNQNACDV